LLITHKTHILEQADKILCIEKGMSVGFGPYSELRTNEEFISLMGSLQAQEEDETKTEKGKPKAITTEKKEQDIKSVKKEEQIQGFAPLSMYCKYMAASYNSYLPVVGIVLFYVFG